ncbi:phosphotransferase family protein [Amycolatopsis sp.]|uniref:phosphotransferase family protein n=1 Tax=Amycolatopsis sp. TaxID=37632 RepID=UPI002CE920F7|nr:phosphotransferase family protein [Amycolatopsis sp.]HVV07979.1 phosphotransferase family protein [Amycolatopsis sp.]
MPELDQDQILRRAARQWPGATLDRLRRLPGGVSSLTFASVLRRPGKPGTPVVVKVAPPGLAPVRNRDVLRQAKILRLLGEEGAVPVPTVLTEDAGDPPLFVMTLAPGESYEPLLDVTPQPPPPSVVTARALAAARALARMRDFPPAKAGERPVPVRAELDRWARLLDTVDPRIAPRHERLYRELAARPPAPMPPCLSHGDFRLANMLFTGERLTAVIDWEIWSAGDPRVDLAWLLMHTDPPHRFHDTRGEADVRAGSGMPSGAALLDAYRETRPGAVPDLPWFLAYSHYKTASTLSVFVKRNRRAAEPEPRLETAAASLPDVIERGREILVHRK